MDIQKTIGTVLPGALDRDAIHIPVIAVQASIKLSPGQHVGLSGDDCNPVGIVDPYLTNVVNIGEYFWLMVYPRTITSLRHIWTHPNIPEDKTTRVTFKSIDLDKQHAKQEAEKWVREYAESIGLSYTLLMDGAKDYIDHDYSISYGGLLEGVSTDPKFWDNYEIILDCKVNINKKDSFFSCSC